MECAPSVGRMLYRVVIVAAMVEREAATGVSTLQSIGLAPMRSRASWARENGRDPKNPREAESGLG